MTHAIVTERLTKYYGPRCVVNCLDLRVPAGTVYGLPGPQRGRQVDDHQDAPGNGPAQLRRGRASGVTKSPTCRPRCAAALPIWRRGIRSTAG